MKVPIMNKSIEPYLQKKFFINILKYPKLDSFITNSHIGRVKGTAKYLLDNLIVTFGNEREYLAVKLAGKFFSYNNIDSKISPHIELPGKFLNNDGLWFIEKLAAVGNGINSSVFTINEVTALKRALFTEGDNSKNNIFLLELDSYRNNLIIEYEKISEKCKKQWVAIELYLNNNSKKVSEVIKDNYSKEIKAIMPSLSLDLIINYEEKSANKNLETLIKKLGIFRVYNKEGVNLAVITPRLTRNSIFNDKVFNIYNESTLAILLRLLILNKIFSLIFKDSNYNKITKDYAYYRKKGHFRAIPAVVNKPLPEPSNKACCNLLASFEDGNDAYNAILLWAGKKYKLTISKKDYLESFNNASYEQKRLGLISQGDINNILPILWGESKDIYRLTYALKGVV